MSEGTTSDAEVVRLRQSIEVQRRRCAVLGVCGDGTKSSWWRSPWPPVRPAATGRASSRISSVAVPRPRC